MIGIHLILFICVVTMMIFFCVLNVFFISCKDAESFEVVLPGGLVYGADSVAKRAWPYQPKDQTSGTQRCLE